MKICNYLSKVAKTLQSLSLKYLIQLLNHNLQCMQAGRQVEEIIGHQKTAYFLITGQDINLHSICFVSNESNPPVTAYLLSISIKGRLQSSDSRDVTLTERLVTPMVVSWVVKAMIKRTSITIIQEQRELVPRQFFHPSSAQRQTKVILGQRLLYWHLTKSQIHHILLFQPSRTLSILQRLHSREAVMQSNCLQDPYAIIPTLPCYRCYKQSTIKQTFS